MQKFLDIQIDLGAETGEDIRPSVQVAQGRLSAVQDRIRESSRNDNLDVLTGLLNEEASLLIETNRNPEAWLSASEALDLGVQEKLWQSAAQSLEIMFLSDQDQSLAALGQGIWLAVTFPVEPELTVALLNHVIDETPHHSDGAAVAAATAIYIVDLRAHGSRHQELSIHARQMLTSVARRHSGVESQVELETWMNRLELNNIDNLLGRLRNIVDVLVQENWRIDRTAIQAEIPDQ